MARVSSPHMFYNPFINNNPITNSTRYYRNDDISSTVKNKLEKSLLKHLNKSTELFYGGYIWYNFTFHNEKESITLLKLWLKDRGLELSDNDNIWLIKFFIKKMEADKNIFLALYYYGYGRKWFNYFLYKKNIIKKILQYGRACGVDRTFNFCVYQIGTKVLWLNRELTKIKRVRKYEGSIDTTIY